MESLRALDLGGGAGALAAGPAWLSCHVAGSLPTLDFAKRAVHRVGFTEKIVLKHGEDAELADLFPAASFDDFYCPIIRGERPQLEIRMAANRDLPKVSSSCTTVVIAR